MRAPAADEPGSGPIWAMMTIFFKLSDRIRWVQMLQGQTKQYGLRRVDRKSFVIALCRFTIKVSFAFQRRVDERVRNRRLCSISLSVAIRCYFKLSNIKR